MRKRRKNNRSAMNCRSCHWPALRAALIAYYQKALTSVHMVDGEGAHITIALRWSNGAFCDLNHRS